MLGKIESKRTRGRQRMRWLDGITDSMDMNVSKLWDILEVRGAWHATGHGVTKSQTPPPTPVIFLRAHLPFPKLICFPI